MVQARYTVDLSDVTRGLALSRTAVIEQIDRGISRGAQLVARSARRGAPKAFSTLTNSIRVTKLGLAAYEIAPGVDYGDHQEQGTRGGRMPPIRSILDWIRVRRIKPRDPNMRERDLAFVVARSIGRRGVPAQPYMGPALDDNTAEIDRLVAEGRDRGVQAAWGD